MNPVLFTVFDTTAEQHALTVAAFQSIMDQDIPVEIHIIDNGSTYPDTAKWLYGGILNDLRCHLFSQPVNISPIKLHNEMLEKLFRTEDYVLSVPNDVVLPPNLYREMLKCPRGVVSAFMTDNANFPRSMTAKVVSEEAHLAVPLIRSWAYDALVAMDGYFLDEGFHFYASDCDLKMRFHALGIRGAQLDILCWHYGSASHRLANFPGAFRGDDDRAYFERKWGFPIGSERYNAVVNNLNWRG
jgi:hypothetical protein